MNDVFCSSSKLPPRREANEIEKKLLTQDRALTHDNYHSSTQLPVTGNAKLEQQPIRYSSNNLENRKCNPGTRFNLQRLKEGERGLSSNREVDERAKLLSRMRWSLIMAGRQLLQPSRRNRAVNFCCGQVFRLNVKPSF